MQDLNDIFYFAQVVSHGGFAAAARAVGVQKSTLSRRVSLLEHQLGATLIYRTSRRFTLTEIGAAYYRKCLVVLEDAQAAQRVVERIHQEPRGTIRIVCPVGLLDYRFGELLADFMARFPKIDLQLKCLNRRVDVIGEGYDLAIQEGIDPHEHTTLQTRHLGGNPQCLVASPQLFESRQPPIRFKDLAGFPSLSFGFPTIDRAAVDPQPKHEWRLHDEKGGTRRIHHTPRLVTDSLATMRSAVLRGLGIGLLPRLMILDDLETGRLIPLFPVAHPEASAIYAVFPSTKALSPAVGSLLEYLTEVLCESGDQSRANAPLTTAVDPESDAELPETREVSARLSLTLPVRP